MATKTKKYKKIRESTEKDEEKRNARALKEMLTFKLFVSAPHTIVDNSLSESQSQSESESESDLESGLSSICCLPQVAHFLVALFDVIIIEVKS